MKIADRIGLFRPLVFNWRCNMVTSEHWWTFYWFIFLLTKLVATYVIWRFLVNIWYFYFIYLDLISSMIAIYPLIYLKPDVNITTLSLIILKLSFGYFYIKMLLISLWNQNVQKWTSQQNCKLVRNSFNLLFFVKYYINYKLLISTCPRTLTSLNISWSLLVVV